MPRGWGRRGIPLVGILAATLPALAQGQATFYSAFEDGLDAEKQGRWRPALQAFQRAAELHPTPAAAVFTYGNNRLHAYYPYAHMARCALELGDRNAAISHLKQSEAGANPPPCASHWHAGSRMRSRSRQLPWRSRWNPSRRCCHPRRSSCRGPFIPSRRHPWNFR